MKNTKRSITLKVLAGYFLIALLIIVGVWFIYPQIKTFIYPEKESATTNKKLTYTSNALSYLYEAETIGRTAMATGSQDQFKQYRVIVDSISPQLDSLRALTTTRMLTQQLDSIKILLNTKTTNISAMVQLRREQYSRNYYDEALAELTKEDIYFEDYSNDPRLDSVDAYTKKVIVDYLEYLRKDNADPDQNLTSMAKTVRETLAKIEDRKKQLEIDIISKENNLLKNDREINLKIRTLLSSFEQEGLLSAKQREELLNSRIDEISKTLKIIGLISIVLALGFVIMIFKDASRSQQYNTELQKSNKVAKSLLKSREQLMATITHDMRSPLNTVIGFTDLLQKTSVDATQNRYLHTIEKSGEYMLQLVNDLLDFSKLEAGKIKIEKIPFNPKNLIEDIIAVAIPAVGKPDVNLKVDVPQELDRLFLSDPFRIKQIVSNLITNAYKFTDSGSITISLVLEKANLIIAVADTGIGIAKHKQKIIFKEFSQAEDHIAQRYGGFGLGLSISQKLADLLNGKLKLESELGKGSTFTLSIPVEETGQKMETSPTITEEFDTNTPKNILLVDDEPMQIKLAQETLKSHPYTITVATNGKEALDQLEHNTFDLILTDIQMPILDGIELIKKIRQDIRLKETPVIALSGNGKLEDDDYKKLGFTSNLKKPYKPDHLIAIIKNLNFTVKPLQENNQHADQAYNLDALNAFADDDPESLKSIIVVFIETAEENLILLNTHAESPEQLKEIAHKMLPMMRQLEATSIVKILEKLENPDGKTISKKVLKSLIHIVEKDTNELLKDLRFHFKV
ncbi:ATP-binding protein [Leeuwenhoekiella sp. MAR_2009_132]|uniref:hybrid sensor histidine kinase/response regulator n=1 Tax=Leeuwenhoekiella sp. MAR_2009_132 TaxID=1392489 RepID=UPI00048BE931|nr:ATP-binding protein [Leeuwenhoekiella sp. MAR_2009_132]